MKLLKAANRNWVLLDTNVLSEAVRSFKSFESFFNALKDLACQPAYSPLIEFEFLRGAYQTAHREVRREFLSKLPFERMPSPAGNALFEDALRIADAYDARGYSSAKIVDCTIAATVLKFRTHMMLATFNLKDFPLFLFKPIGLIPIESGGVLKPLGVFVINETRAHEAGLL